MKYLLLAIGHLKKGPAKDLYLEYMGRLKTPIEVREEKDDNADLTKHVPPNAKLIVLDEQGQTLSSGEFAQIIETYQNQGTSQIVFAIGGSNGHSDTMRHRADLLLSLGRMTWPHLLVRGLLAEQLYRVQQILAHHPYHK